MATSGVMAFLGRVVGIGLAWGALWLALGLAVWAIAGLVHPGVIDHGEGPLAVAAVFGPMGFLSGAAFALLLLFAERARTAAAPPGSPSRMSALRVAGWGALGTAIAQLAYLGHGDHGLAANLHLALLHSAVGGVVAMAWLGLARGWSRRRSAGRLGA